MKRNAIIKLVFILLLPLIYSCGEKFDINQFDTSNNGNINIGGDTVYVPIKPAWKGFNHPQAMIIGREPFIYICDTDNNRIVMMNLNGDVLGTRSIKQPTSIAQDFKLNLIVCAEFDTTVSGQTQTYSAVYKFNMVAASHHIENAPVKMLLPRSVDLNNPQLQYTGVSVFYDNSFYISRTGPNNASIGAPDNSILIFKHKLHSDGTPYDTLTGRVPNLDPLSSGIPSANKISSLTSFPRKNFDIILTLTGNTSFKTQWLSYVESQNFTGYVTKLTPGQVSMMRPNRFTKPEGATIDEAGDIFVADAEKDSVFKFNAFGDELQSFGGTDVFKEPYAVAFFDKTLYVVDRGNNQILRFILSTDL